MYQWTPHEEVRHWGRMLDFSRYMSGQYCTALLLVLLLRRWQPAVEGVFGWNLQPRLSGPHWLGGIEKVYQVLLKKCMLLKHCCLIRKNKSNGIRTGWNDRFPCKHTSKMVTHLSRTIPPQDSSWFPKPFFRMEHSCAIKWHYLTIFSWTNAKLNAITITPNIQTLIIQLFWSFRSSNHQPSNICAWYIIFQQWCSGPPLRGATLVMARLRLAYTGWPSTCMVYCCFIWKRNVSWWHQVLEWIGLLHPHFFVCASLVIDETPFLAAYTDGRSQKETLAYRQSIQRSLKMLDRITPLSFAVFDDQLLWRYNTLATKLIHAST